ncbi:uncharacterized protein AMSG_05639 [Thecamonas trahens ATCC 50062]|uniref:Transmembrane protein n=1 Tax=Thecamonas trahens ATCC 50062 TaxID=461836 RepID=A0A0L0DB89_THETB|nr:hypothetical protein AMSG_05639 [Thecamonas trahens ATCC 50062]KNC49599.1 hypothetical protein AMSG_05639 [Thecamonas trahens ATCC 50062]|eukprot:XP_013757707.1 hypothetical protein AMSG_05639 [Thecamonas trahens ATCC 50062]
MSTPESPPSYTGGPGIELPTYEEAVAARGVVATRPSAATPAAATTPGRTTTPGRPGAGAGTRRGSVEFANLEAAAADVARLEQEAGRRGQAGAADDARPWWLPLVEPCPFTAMYLTVTFVHLFHTYLIIRFLGYGSGEPIVPLVVGLVLFLVVVPVVAIIIFFCWYLPGVTEHIDDINFYHDDELSAQFFIVLGTMAVACAVAACTGGVYLALLGVLNDPVEMYNGPVPDLGSPQLEALAAGSFARFTDPQLGWRQGVTGEHISKLRTKSGVLHLPSYTTPVTRPSTSREQVSVWACACAKPRNYGCRVFPAIDVTGGRRQGMWERAKAIGGLRIKSRKILDTCQRSASNAMAKTEFNSFYSPGISLQDAVYIEWTDLAVYRRQIKVISWSVISSFLFTALLAVVLTNIFSRCGDCYHGY